MTDEKKSPRPDGAGTGAKNQTRSDYTTEAANDILWHLEKEITAAFCANCEAAYIERGARSGGLQITPDEINCPAEFEIGEPGCVKAHIWKELQGLALDMAELLREAEA